MNTSALQIPHFSLYGEEQHIDDPDFIHIEQIAHRSQEHGWVIRPHRHHNMFQMIVMLSGSVDIRLDEQKLTITDPVAVTIPAGCVHGFRFAPDTQGVVLTLADSVLNTEQFTKVSGFLGVLLSHPQVLKLKPGDDDFRQLMWLVSQIAWELNNPRLGRSLICECYSLSLMTLIRRIHDQQGENNPNESPQNRLIRDLKSLIEQNFREQWNVQQYADAMGTTTTTLNRMTLQFLNKTVKAMLLERLLLEAKRRLIYTRGNLDQIAFDLGFKDPAYFSRFFKRETGMTPGQMRRQMQNEDSPVLVG
jgi:AraC family transcriptional activator of pobA